MYTFLVILIIIASILLILTVLAQSPKSGMAANFGASNQVMGVRQTSNFLEKASWYLAIGIVVLCILSTVAMRNDSTISDSVLENVVNTVETPVMPAEATEIPAAEAATDAPVAGEAPAAAE